jgi:hypothetical protein
MVKGTPKSSHFNAGFQNMSKKNKKCRCPKMGVPPNQHPFIDVFILYKPSGSPP